MYHFIHLFINSSFINKDPYHIINFKKCGNYMGSGANIIKIIGNNQFILNITQLNQLNQVLKELMTFELNHNNWGFLSFWNWWFLRNSMDKRYRTLLSKSIEIDVLNLVLETLGWIPFLFFILLYFKFSRMKYLRGWTLRIYFGFWKIWLNWVSCRVIMTYFSGPRLRQNPNISWIKTGKH